MVIRKREKTTREVLLYLSLLVLFTIKFYYIFFVENSSVDMNAIIVIVINYYNLYLFIHELLIIISKDV